MVRFGVRSRFLIYGNLEKCLDTTSIVRNNCGVAVNGSAVRQRYGSTLHSSCLIDSATPSAAANAIQAQSRRLSSSSSVSETRKTCLYDLHVQKQGE